MTAQSAEGAEERFGMQRGKRRTVVCIDDDIDMVTLIRLILRHVELEFIGAVDGHTGLEAIRDSRPDLVLLDLMLPDIDGWEICSRMKADRELKDIPVVVVTSKTGIGDRRLGLEVFGVDDYVTKPFVNKELERSVKQVLSATV